MKKGQQEKGLYVIVIILAWKALEILLSDMSKSPLF